MLHAVYKVRAGIHPPAVASSPPPLLSTSSKALHWRYATFRSCSLRGEHHPRTWSSTALNPVCSSASWEQRESAENKGKVLKTTPVQNTHTASRNQGPPTYERNFMLGSTTMSLKPPCSSSLGSGLKVNLLWQSAECRGKHPGFCQWRGPKQHQWLHGRRIWVEKEP